MSAQFVAGVFVGVVFCMAIHGIFEGIAGIAALTLHERKKSQASDSSDGETNSTKGKSI